MAFTLQLSDQSTVTFDDSASYRFNEQRLLVIREGNSRRIFSPFAWTWLEDNTSGRGRTGKKGAAEPI